MLQLLLFTGKQSVVYTEVKPLRVWCKKKREREREREREEIPRIL
jgi:hypothetical protein